jgi:hypothetical protein
MGSMCLTSGRTATVTATAAVPANDPLYCPAWFAAQPGDPSGPGLRAWQPACLAVRPASNQHLS